MVFFWITFATLLITLIWGLVTMLSLYDRIDGGAGGHDVSDLDRLVRESW